jgi:hypothetical protein
MISHGTTHLVCCLGPYAIKIAKGERGRRCNRFEAALWKRTTEERRKMLCPILATIPFGVALVMKRAKPLSEEEKDHPSVLMDFLIGITCRLMSQRLSSTRHPIGDGLKVAL